MMKRLIIFALAVFFGCVNLSQAQDAHPLSEVLEDWQGYSWSDIQDIAAWEAQNDGPLYPSAPQTTPHYESFEGSFTPADSNTKIAIFSDDGCDVFINGNKVHSAKGRGQALPNLSQSLHKISFSFQEGQTYQIRVDYSNTVYLGSADIDGASLFAYTETPPNPTPTPTSTPEPEKIWNVGLPIGKNRVSDGSVVDNGRMTAPQNQTSPNFSVRDLEVTPGRLLTCAVESATDLDRWDVNLMSGEVSDSVSYQWSANVGVFIVTAADGTKSRQATASGQNAVFEVPSNANTGDTITLKCRIDDGAPDVIAPDSGTRNDDVVERTVTLRVVSNASARLLVIDSNNNELSGTVGGTVQVALELNLETTSIVSQKATVRIEETEHIDGAPHHETESHLDFLIDFKNKNEWQKFYDPDNEGPQQEGWFASPDVPGGTGKWRRLISWNTSGPPQVGERFADGQMVAGKLLNHNGAHELAISSVDNQAGSTLDLDGADDVNVEKKDVAIHNLVIENVWTNAKNADYIKFDPDSQLDEFRQPTVKFSISDNGDPHKYYWVVYVRPTFDSEWLNQANSYVGIHISGVTNGVGDVEAKWNGLDPQGNLAKPGTYAFDIVVWETDTTNFNPVTDAPLDSQGQKSHQNSYWLYVPKNDADNSPGHTLEENFTENGRSATASYILNDAVNSGANNVNPKEFGIDIVDGYMEKVATKPLPKVANQKVIKTEFYQFGDNEPYGVWRYIFRGEDANKKIYRDHKNKRIVVVNTQKKDYGRLKQVYTAAEIAVEEYYKHQGWTILASATRKAYNQGGADFIAYRYNLAKKRYDIQFVDNKALSAENAFKRGYVEEGSKHLSALFTNWDKNLQEGIDLARAMPNQQIGAALVQAMQNPQDASHVKRVVTYAGGKGVMRYAPSVLRHANFQSKNLGPLVNDKSRWWKIAWEKAGIALSGASAQQAAVIAANPALANQTKQKVVQTVVAKAGGKIAGKAASVAMIGYYIYQAKQHQNKTGASNEAAANYALQLAYNDTFFIEEIDALIAWEQGNYDRFVKDLRKDVRGYGNFKITDSLIDGLSDPNWPNEDLG